MAKVGDEEFFGGRGRPLTDLYAVKEEDWPAIWAMPDEWLTEASDQGGMSGLCAFADDVVLRAAINAYDNCGRLPGAADAVAAGMLGALSRFLIGLNPNGNLDALSSKLAESLNGMLAQHRDIAKGGWFGT